MSCILKLLQGFIFRFPLQCSLSPLLSLFIQILCCQISIYILSKQSFVLGVFCRILHSCSLKIGHLDFPRSCQIDLMSWIYWSNVWPLELLSHLLWIWMISKMPWVLKFCSDIVGAFMCLLLMKCKLSEFQVQSLYSFIIMGCWGIICI